MPSAVILYTLKPENPDGADHHDAQCAGVEEGGSGVPLDREVYRRSVAFWEGNASWRP